MSIKIISAKDTFDTIRSAVGKAVDLIAPTYGPAGNKVIISKVLNKMVVDDGVQIARDLELEDPAENAVMSVIRETAVRTNDRVGDGTTGSLIMLRAIVEEVAKKSARDGRAIEKDLKRGFEDAKRQILAMAKPVKTLEDLERVARISFDDPRISKMVAKAWHELGPDGILTVDRSGTMETTLDIADGVKIDRGYVSQYMVTNPQRMEGIVEKPYILITDYRLTEASDVLPVMGELLKKKVQSLVIICENIEQAALATVIVNRQNPNGPSMNVIAVNAPAGGDRTVLLEDLALLTGARLFSEKKGDKLEEVKIEDLGRAARFIARRDSSAIVGPKGDRKAVREAAEAALKAAEASSDEYQKRELRARAARFNGKVAVVRVGAATENEERALRYKVEDAIHATQAAYKGGVVPGGGVALASLKTSSDLLNEALKRPFEQLKKNMGIDRPYHDIPDGDALNVVTGRVGPFQEVGVMDPADVLVAGVESAVSIASILLTSCGMVVEEPKKPKAE